MRRSEGATFKETRQILSDFLKNVFLFHLSLSINQSNQIDIAVKLNKIEL